MNWNPSIALMYMLYREYFTNSLKKKNSIYFVGYTMSFNQNQRQTKKRQTSRLYKKKKKKNISNMVDYEKNKQKKNFFLEIFLIKLPALGEMKATCILFMHSVCVCVCVDKNKIFHLNWNFSKNNGLIFVLWTQNVKAQNMRDATFLNVVFSINLRNMIHSFFHSSLKPFKIIESIRKSL